MIRKETTNVYDADQWESLGNMGHTQVGRKCKALEVATVQHECEAKYLEHQKTHDSHCGKGAFAAKGEHHPQRPDYEYRGPGCPQPMGCGSGRMTWGDFE
jgi:hypothetical protein